MLDAGVYQHTVVQAEARQELSGEVAEAVLLVRAGSGPEQFRVGRLWVRSTLAEVRT
jgi:hypothetical protein